MPQAIPVIALAVGKAAGAALGLGALGQAVFGAVAGFVSSSLLKKKPQSPSFSVGPVNRSQLIRQSDAPREYAYGQTLKSGPLLFHYTSQDNRNFYMVVAIASHSIEEYQKVYIGEEERDVSSDFDVDTSYASLGITHKKIKSSDSLFYKDSQAHLWVDFSFGATNTAVNQRFQQEINQDAGETIISDTDYFRGISCVYVKLRWGVEGVNGVPNIRALIRGKNDILDTRTSTTGYSTNPALCLYDYLTDDLIGLGAATSELDTTAANTAANVCDESVSLNGGGTEDRYTCNGAIDSSARLSDGIESFLSAMAGQLVYVNGKFKILAGEYRSPTVTITEDDILAPISVGRAGKRDRFNAVKGTYLNELEEWKPTDFPHVTNSTYQTEDGERIYTDVEYAFTISGATAQRMATIELERNRQDITCSLVISPRQWDIAAGDTVQITYSPLGWSSKVFEVQERSFTNIGDDANPLFGVKLILRETSTSVFTWSSNETTVDAAPNTNLPDPFTVTAISGLTLDSTETQLVRGRNGRIVSRIKVSWDTPTDAFILDGGRVEVQAKRSTDSTYETVGTVSGDVNFSYVTDVDDRVNYDVRVRAINAVGSISTYTTVTGHTVIGKTSNPPNVTGFDASEVLGVVRFKWDQLDILDVYGYEIRYGADGVQWKDGIPLTQAKQGTSETSASVPPGTWSFLIKAVDYVGNYSTSAATRGPVQVSNVNSVLNAIDDGAFPGTLDNFILHYTGVLVPDDQKTANQYDFEVFDNFVPTPEQICTYTSSEIDLGSDQDVRVWGDIESSLGPGVSTGTADPKLQICYRSSADSSSGTGDQRDLISSSGTYTNCILHYTGAVVPDSQSLANAADFEIFDNFVYNPYENCSYESEEIDLGSDQNIILDIQNNAVSGPGETGTPEHSLKIDTRTSSESYDGFSLFTAGSYNLRYYKVLVEWNNLTNDSFIGSLVTDSSCWRDWVIGNLNDVRYIQARIRLDTNVGLAKITDFNWTVDA